MNMTDRILVRRRDAASGSVPEQAFGGVNCVMSHEIVTDDMGFKTADVMVIRIPGEVLPDILCGDQVAKAGESRWFTVAEVKDNRKKGSGLSHYKIIGRR